MKSLYIFIFFILIVSGTAQATYINDLAFGLGNGAYITVNTTTIDDSNQLACCDNNQLMMKINGSMANFTSGANKTLSSITYNNITDVFTIPVTGSSYINFSAVMKNASNSYNMTASGVYVESRNTTTGKVVWFNYTGVATIAVSWNSSSGGSSPSVIDISINSYSPGVQYNTIRSGNSITFQVLSATNVVDYHWTYDDGTAGDTSDTYIKTFNINTGSNLHYVKVYGTNGSNMSNTVEWRISVMKALAVVPVTTLNESSWHSMNSSIDSMDMAGFIVNTMSVYTNVMGNYFYLLLWGIVFVMLWIRQGSITIPSTLGMILGAIVIAMLPSEYQMVAQAMIAMGIIAVIYVTFSERG